MEASASLKGTKIEGEGYHRKLIDWATEKHGIPGKDRRFLQELRKKRNRISYEGFFLEKDYLERNQKKIEKIISKLKRELEKELDI